MSSLATSKSPNGTRILNRICAHPTIDVPPYSVTSAPDPNSSSIDSSTDSSVCHATDDSEDTFTPPNGRSSQMTLSTSLSSSRRTSSSPIERNRKKHTTVRTFDLEHRNRCLLRRRERLQKFIKRVEFSISEQCRRRFV